MVFPRLVSNFDRWEIVASSIHGITTEKAILHGHNLKSVLHEFLSTLKVSSYLVAHTMSLDENVVGAELLRLGIPNLLTTKKKVCTYYPVN